MITTRRVLSGGLPRHFAPGRCRGIIARGESHSWEDTIVIAIDHEFRMAMPSKTRRPVTMRAYAANGKTTKRVTLVCGLKRLQT